MHFDEKICTKISLVQRDLKGIVSAQNEKNQKLGKAISRPESPLPVPLDKGNADSWSKIEFDCERDS